MGGAAPVRRLVNKVAGGFYGSVGALGVGRGIRFRIFFVFFKFLKDLLLTGRCQQFQIQAHD